MFKMFDREDTAGAVSNAVKMPKHGKRMILDTVIEHRAATAVSACEIAVQGSMKGADKDTGVITGATLAVDSTATKFANAAFYFRIAGTNYSVAADSAGNAFSAAHVIGDGESALYGCINVYINSSGAFVTKVPVSPQIYATAELAMAAADAIETTSNLCYAGRILIQSDTSAWTANTDDMTDGSDLTTATFYSASSSFITLQDGTGGDITDQLTATELTNGRSLVNIPVSDTMMGAGYVRLYLKTLTGTGYVTSRLKIIGD
jgi:hypothetical protein